MVVNNQRKSMKKFLQSILIVMLALIATSCYEHKFRKLSKLTKRDYNSATICYNSFVSEMGGVCRYIKVKAEPKNRENRRYLDIYYSIVPATDKTTPKKEPIVFLVGGPGQSATFLIDYTLKINTPYQQLLKNHDFIFIDYRGTGFSRPFPICKTFNSKKYVDSINSCVKELPKNVHLTDITTDNIVYDINEILKKENIKKVILFGGSYGTRVASTMARDYPSRVKKMILDGFFPIEVNGISQAKESLLSNLEIIRAKYNKKYKNENFEKRLIKYLQKIDKKKRLSRITTISLMAYVDNVEVNLKKEFDNPSKKFGANNKVNSEDYTSLVDKKFAYRGDDSKLMLFAIILREEMAFTKIQHAKSFNFSKKLISMMNGFNGGSPIAIDKLKRIKIELSKPNLKDTKALKSKIPTLILSGGLDLFTPVYWAKNAQRYLANSKHFLFVDKGHVFSTSSKKAVEIIDAFLNTNNLDSLNLYETKNIKIIK